MTRPFREKEGVADMARKTAMSAQRASPRDDATADAGRESNVDKIAAALPRTKTPFCNGPGDAVIFKNDWPGEPGLKGVPDGKVVKTVH